MEEGREGHEGCTWFGGDGRCCHCLMVFETQHELTTQATDIASGGSHHLVPEDHSASSISSRVHPEEREPPGVLLPDLNQQWAWEDEGGNQWPSFALSLFSPRLSRSSPSSGNTALTGVEMWVAPRKWTEALKSTQAIAKAITTKVGWEPESMQGWERKGVQWAQWTMWPPRGPAPAACSSRSLTYRIIQLLKINQRPESCCEMHCSKCNWNI